MESLNQVTDYFLLELEEEGNKIQLLPTTKLIRNRITKPLRNFSGRWGPILINIDDLSSAPPNIILDVFRL